MPPICSHDVPKEGQVLELADVMGVDAVHIN